MLTSVHFRNIRSLQELRLELAPFTVLVGPNGCGKSSVLDQVQRLCWMSQPDLNISRANGLAGLALEGIDASRTHGATEAMRWSGEALSGATWCVELGPETSLDWYYRIDQRGRSAEGATITLEATRLFGDKHKEGLVALKDDLAAYLNWRAITLALRRETLQKPSPLRQSVTSLEHDGYGLPSLLADFKFDDRAAWDAVQADLRRVVPHFRSLDLPRVKLDDNGNVGFSLQLELEGAGKIDASAASEGTLFALALLAVAHSRALPEILLIDDLDHGLHLSAQVEVISAIRRVMAQRPGLQVICTTHSPDMLNCFDASEVRVMALDANGHSRARGLVEHPDYARFKTSLHTGEFWASVGEDWVTEERAGA